VADQDDLVLGRIDALQGQLQVARNTWTEDAGGHRRPARVQLDQQIEPAPAQRCCLNLLGPVAGRKSSSRQRGWAERNARHDLYGGARSGEISEHRLAERAVAGHTHDDLFASFEVLFDHLSMDIVERIALHVEGVEAGPGQTAQKIFQTREKTRAHEDAGAGRA